MQLVPYVNISPQRIIAFAQPSERRPKNNIIKYTGKSVHDMVNGLSGKASARMYKAINALCYSSIWKTLYCRSEDRHYRYKVTLITLTLPSKQVHSDKEIISKVFSPFMEAWQKRMPGLLYVWKAEVQDNGNLHFHITTNVFYHHKALRTDWNKAINKLGYVDRSGLTDPNSTDVHSVKKVNNLASYMASYLTKKDERTKVLKRYHRIYRKQLSAYKENLFKLPRNYFKHIKRKVTCRIWSASKALLNSTATIHADDWRIKKDLSIILPLKEYWVEHPYCSILYLENNAFPSLPQLYQVWKEANAELFLLQEKVSKHTVLN